MSAAPISGLAVITTVGEAPSPSLESPAPVSGTATIVSSGVKSGLSPPAPLMGAAVITAAAGKEASDSTPVQGLAVIDTLGYNPENSASGKMKAVAHVSFPGAVVTVTKPSTVVTVE